MTHAHGTRRPRFPQGTTGATFPRVVHACALCASSLTACGDPGGQGVLEKPAAFPDLRQRFSDGTAPLGYIANTRDDTVSVVDLDGMALVGTAPIGRDPVTIDGPRRLSMGAGHQIVHAVLSYPHEVVSPHVAEFGGSIRAGYVQSLSVGDLRPLGAARAELRAFDIALSPDGTRLAVTHYDILRSVEGDTLQERRANLVLIDLEDGVASANVARQSFELCVAPSSVVYPNADRLYVACTGEDSIAVVDAREGTVLTRVTSGPESINGPWSLSVNPAGDRLLVSNQLSEAVAVFTTDDEPDLVEAVAIGAVPFEACWVSDTEVIVAAQSPGGLVRVDIEASAVTAKAEYDPAECQNPNGPTLVDGRLYVVCEGNHYEIGALVEVDPYSFEIIDGVDLGIYPETMAVVAR